MLLKKNKRTGRVIGPVMLTDEIVVFSEKTMSAYGQRVLNLQKIIVTVKLSRIIRLRGGLEKKSIICSSFDQ